MGGGRAKKVLLHIIKNALKPNAVTEYWVIVMVCGFREGYAPFLLV